ncbi:MAG: phosphatase PAP2 family protein [FCB group bacterium]|nr:phosphatase PAP2 family protein [FCB group bacterium]
MRYPDTLTLTDRLVFIYLSLITLVVLIGWQSLNNPGIQLSANLVLGTGIWGLSKIRAKYPTASFLKVIHLFYPIPLLIWWYPQATILRHVFIETDLDAWLLPVEKFLFRREWYLILPSHLPLWIIDFFHLVYFFYYLSLLLFASLAVKRQASLVAEYVFVLMGVMLTLQLVILVFPSSGPVDQRSITLPHRLMFASLMDWVYRTFDHGGGAFPSIHSAAAWVMNRYSRRFFPRWSWAFDLLLISILIATVACSYHYVIDVVSGVLLGILLMNLLQYIYRTFQVSHGT